MKLTDKQKSEGWIITKFGDIAEQISKRVNPVAADSSNYIGLEHLDSDSLRVSRWGTEIVLKGQKLAMKKGDILFAKRNAYLRRVAIAPIDGIFSAHGMILRPKGDLAISGFLPFFMQSDMFMERAVAISEGSLSPTIKWKVLANQDFPLPPRSQQEKILMIARKIYHISNKTYDSYLSSLDFLQRIIDEFIRNDHRNDPKEGWQRMMIKSIANANALSLKEKTHPDYEFNYIDISSIKHPGQLLSPEKIAFKDAPSRAKRIVRVNDVLVSTVRPNHRATLFIDAAKSIDHIASTGFCVLTPKPGISGEWLFYATLSKAFTHSMINLMVGTSFPAVSDDDILVQKIDYPKNPNVLKDYLVSIKAAHSTTQQLLAKFNKVTNLQKQIFRSYLQPD